MPESASLKTVARSALAEAVPSGVCAVSPLAVSARSDPTGRVSSRMRLAASSSRTVPVSETVLEIGPSSWIEKTENPPVALEPLRSAVLMINSRY